MLFRPFNNHTKTSKNLFIMAFNKLKTLWKWLTNQKVWKIKQVKCKILSKIRYNK